MEMAEHEYRKLARIAMHFFIDKEGQLYRQNPEGKHKLVVEKSK